MTIKKFAQVAFGGAFIFALTQKRSQAALAITPKSSSKVAVEEILSYECARSVAGIVGTADQVGPLFANGSLVFTSLEAQDSSKILLVNAGHGNFAVNLEGDGVNRIRFEIPVAGRGPSRMFFLTYLHGGSYRSRYFDFSEGRPPVGKDELDYSYVSARRADYLQPHLDYAIHETAEATLNAITEGRIQRQQLRTAPVEGCEYIARQSASLARNLKHNLDMLDLIVSGPGARRLPASVSQNVHSINMR